MTMQIELKNISCKIGNHNLLHNINWQVNQGEKWIVFGENGSGKTTLLSIIAGYRRYSGGELYLFGEKYDPTKTLDYRKEIGFISTSFYNKIFRNESVLSIVLSGKTGTFGISEFVSNQDLKEAKHLLRLFRIESKKDSPYRMLSKGEQQCVLLARAFMGERKILLLDEADSGLDYLARLRLDCILSSIVDETTMIYVTHYPNEISPFFDHGMLLKNGKIYAKNQIDQVFTSEIISDFFEFSLDVEKTKNGYRFAQRGDKYADLWRA